MSRRGGIRYQLSGNLRQFALPDILRVIESGQRTGALVFSRGKLRAAIYFSAGQWLLAERIGSGLVLAQHLARCRPDHAGDVRGRHGHLPLAEAGEVPDVQIVRTLIGAHLLNHDDLRTFAVDDAVNLLTIMLGWPDGDFFFEDGTPPPQGRLALPLPVGPLVAQALRYAKAGGAASPVNGVGSVSGANGMSGMGGMHGAPSANGMPPTRHRARAPSSAWTPCSISPRLTRTPLPPCSSRRTNGASSRRWMDACRWEPSFSGCKRLSMPILRLAAELLASRVLVVVGSSSGPQTGILPG